MRKIVTVHSHHDGPGKSELTANLAASVARLGKRVGLLAVDPTAHALHALFGLDPKYITHTVADYLDGRCAIPEASYRVTPREVSASGGNLYLIPAGPPNEAHSAEKLSVAFEQALAALHLDFMFLDAPAGADERALLSIVAADSLVLVLRPDRQDYLGTAVAIDVARKLGVANILLVLHEVPASLDPDTLRADLERVFAAEVGAVIAGGEDAPGGAGTGLLVVQLPGHPFSQGVSSLAAHLVHAG